jgi:hypothetical protein
LQQSLFNSCSTNQEQPITQSEIKVYNSEELFAAEVESLQDQLSNQSENTNSRVALNIDPNSEIPEFFQPILNELNQVAIGGFVFELDFQNNLVFVTAKDDFIAGKSIAKTEKRVALSMEIDIFSELEDAGNDLDQLIENLAQQDEIDADPNARVAMRRCRNVYNFDDYAPIGTFLGATGTGADTYTYKARVRHVKYGIYFTIFSEFKIIPTFPTTTLVGYYRVNYDHNFIIRQRCKRNRDFVQSGSEGLFYNGLLNQWEAQINIYRSSRGVSMVDATYTTELYENANPGNIILEADDKWFRSNNT